MNDSHITQLDLQAMAEQIMLEHGFEPEFPAAVQQQLADIKARSPLAPVSPQDVRDLRGLLWSSIDNDTSRDLDQIEVADSCFQECVVERGQLRVALCRSPDEANLRRALVQSTPL